MVSNTKYPGTALHPASLYCVWSTNNSVDYADGVTASFTLPSVSAPIGANNNALTTKITFMYCLLNFTVSINYDSVSQNFPLPTPTRIQYRVAVVKRRDGNSPLTTIDLLSMNQPLDAKQFDIQYDRVFALQTGLPISYRQNNGTVQSLNNGTGPSLPRQHKFRIPIKFTGELIAGNVTFPQDIFVLIWCYNDFGQNFWPNTSWPLGLYDVVARYYYTTV